MTDYHRHSNISPTYTWDADRKEIQVSAPFLAIRGIQSLTMTKQDLLDMARAMPQKERPQEHQISDDRIQAWAGLDGKLASLEIHVNLLRDFLLTLGIYTMTADELLEKNPIIAILEARLKEVERDRDEFDKERSRLALELDDARNTRIKLDERISAQRGTLSGLQRSYDASQLQLKQMNDNTRELAIAKAKLTVITEQCRQEIAYRNTLTAEYNKQMETSPFKRAQELENKVVDLTRELNTVKDRSQNLTETNQSLRMRLEAQDQWFQKTRRSLCEWVKVGPLHLYNNVLELLNDLGT